MLEAYLGLFHNHLRNSWGYSPGEKLFTCLVYATH